jgi:glycine/D-amino acid oxidase-like deaminating enzyme
MSRIIIVGGGLFGSLAATLATREGHSVLILDRQEELAGSRPAACLMKPGWMTGLKDKSKRGLTVLDRLYGLTTLNFKLGPTTVPVFWVDPRRILEYHGAETRHADVAGVGDGWVKLRSGEELTADFILVTAGIWTADLTPVPDMRSLVGSAFTFHETPCPEPFIKVWAPYKQLVAFEREPGATWIGDGSAILHKNWTGKRMEQSLTRCWEAVGSPRGNIMQAQTGCRPYVPSAKTGLFERRAPGLFVSTGGAKNGTVIAAAQAQDFLDAI